MDNESTQSIVLETPFPELKVNEGSKLTPIDLKKHLKSPVDEPLEFTAMLSDGNPLPLGVTCSPNGILNGAPAKGTASQLPYEISITAESESVEPLTFSIKLLVLPVEVVEKTQQKAEEKIEALDEDELSEEEKAERAEFEEEKAFYKDEVEMQGYMDQLSGFWKSYADGLELPPLNDILSRKVTPLDIYHLLGRFATLVIWNADDLTPATVGKEITLAGQSERYRVYDFKVALVMTPKDLFDPVRTLGDGLKTVRSLIAEVQKRKWNIELAGYDKLVTATWVEVQKVNRLNQGHHIELRNYEPDQPDLDVLTLQLNLQAASAA